MIEAVFSAQPLLMALLVTVSAVLATTGLFLGRRFNHPKRFFWALAGAGLGIAISATLTPAKESSGYSGTCTINKDLLQSVDTEQWLLNLLLFAPAALFLILAGASRMSSVATVATMSMAIEFTQATLPGIGRACDSDDFVANTLGAAIAAVVVTASSSLRGGFHASRPKAGQHRRAFVVHGAAIALVAVTGFSMVTMSYVDSDTPIKEASSSQERKVSRTLAALFGSSPRLTRTQISNLPNSYEPGQQTLIASWQSGNAEFSWPSAKIHKIWTSEGIALRGSGRGSSISSGSAAKSLASWLVARSFPWAAAATKISAAPDPQFSQAWRVAYQQKLNDITMPLLFDVTFSKDGRLMELTAEDSPVPNRVPPAKVPLKTASHTAALHAPAHWLQSAAELRLVKEGTDWVTAWDFTYVRSKDASNSYSPLSVLVNATSGNWLPRDGSAID